jgi:hypothetical protein
MYRIMLSKLSDMPTPKVTMIDKTVKTPCLWLLLPSVELDLLDGNNNSISCESIIAEAVSTTDVTTACLNSIESSM